MPPPAHVGGDRFDTPVRDLMSPGVLSVVEDASLRQVLRAIGRHRVHAILVCGRQGGPPLGWVTVHGLLGWVDADHALSVARDAITERAITVEPGAPARDALRLMLSERVAHLIVAHRPDVMPEGVVGEMDLLGLLA